MIYLDNMASTPIDAEVLHAMLPYMQQDSLYANPSSAHAEGGLVSEAIEHARQKVAMAINADPDGIVWTSGATESINLAVKGAADFYQRKGRHIITLKTEHQATLDVCQVLERQGYEVTYLTPEPNGLLAVDTLKQALRDDTVLVSLLQVNNETGVVQDIANLAKVIHQRGALLHVDGAQSMGKVKVDVDAMGIDLMSLASHKVYGPKGVGALYIRQQPKLRITPLLHGGGQSLRPGTLPTHQIVGMGKAYELAITQFDQDCQRLLEMKTRFWQAIKTVGGVVLNSPFEISVPHCINVSFAGVDGESLLLALRDTMLSSGSACNAATIEPSHVLTAMGVETNLANASVRFSPGRFTSLSELEAVAKQTINQVKILRQLSAGLISKQGEA